MFGNHLGLPEFVLFILIIFPLAIYLIPTIIAIVRRQSNMVAVILIDILAGWTLVGWVIALVLSLTTPKVKSAASNGTT